jgi:hypothetical protein
MANSHSAVILNWFGPFRAGSDRVYFNVTLQSDMWCSYVPTLPIFPQGGAAMYPP